MWIWTRRRFCPNLGGRTTTLRIPRQTYRMIIYISHGKVKTKNCETSFRQEGYLKGYNLMKKEETKYVMESFILGNSFYKLVPIIFVTAPWLSYFSLWSDAIARCRSRLWKTPQLVNTWQTVGTTVLDRSNAQWRGSNHSQPNWNYSTYIVITREIQVTLSYLHLSLYSSWTL